MPMCPSTQRRLPLALVVCCALAWGGGLAIADDAPRPATGATVAVNGIDLYYETSGQGEPLMLLHGFMGSARQWDKFVPELAKHFLVIVPDLRGHGRSSNPSGRFTHRDSAQDMFGLMEKLGLKKISAMGISSGGMTLIHMATQRPSQVTAMVLIGATPYFPEQARAIMRQTTPESVSASDLERLRKRHLRGDEQIRALFRQFHEFKDSYDDMNFTGPLLSTITARTLIIHGDRDEFFPVSIPLEMYQSIPRASLWIIPNGDHVPISDPKVPFVATALDFLRKEERK